MSSGRRHPDYKNSTYSRGRYHSRQSVNRKTGVRIISIVPGSIFTKMGLRGGDLIIGINDQEISGLEEASALIQAIGDGGDVDLKVRRRARTYRIHLQIQ